MTVAKSGRTTGLTCASVSTVSLDVEVSYYTNCAETDPYYTKTYTNQSASRAINSATRATPDHWWWIQATLSQ